MEFEKVRWGSKRFDNYQTSRHATPRHATPRHATPRHEGRRTGVAGFQI